MTASGIAPAKALEKLGSEPARRAAAALSGGGGFGEAFRAAGFPAADAACAEAGEATGRLEEVFRTLERHHARIADARRAAISRCLYPAFVLHLAAFLLPLPPAILAGDVRVYGQGVLAILLVAYGSAGCLALLAFAARRAFAASTFGVRVIAAVPVVGALFVTGTAGRFAGVFALFARSGASLLRGIELAGASCGNARLREAASRARDCVRDHQTLASAFPTGPGIPEEIGSAVQVGEDTGRMDEELARASMQLEEANARLLAALAEWVPRLLYLAVALFVGWAIISSVMAVGGAYGELLEYD